MIGRAGERKDSKSAMLKGVWKKKWGKLVGKRGRGGFRARGRERDGRLAS